MEKIKERIENIKVKMEEIKPNFPELTEGQLRLEAIRQLAK
jgi:hypothetical protein